MIIRARRIRSQAGFALVDVVMMMIVVSLTGAAALSFWAVASRASIHAVESSTGYSAAKSALNAARSHGESACPSTTVMSECALSNAGLAPELVSAGWSSSVSAKSVAANPAESGASSSDGILVQYEAVATSATGGAWAMSALQWRPYE